jgi:PBP1b-binding outer membrane lipoprotein LpoB
LLSGETSFIVVTFLSNIIGGGNWLMRMVKLSVWAFVVLALAMFWVGCSKPPEAEKEAAKKAMEDAISAGAEKYATADLEAAKKIWDTADSQMKEKKYKEAKQSYLDVKAAFEKAAAAVEAGKKAAADQAKGTLNAVEEEWKKLNATAQKMDKKLKEKKQAWKADAKAINDGLGRAKERIASAPAEAKAELDELKAMIDRWKTTFKEMAKAPTKPKVTKKKKTV